MRYGIIADPHGNEEALVACLERLRAERVDRIVCLGDVVGYNAAPNECARRLVEARAEVILGNHELIALGDLGLGSCADKVAYALRRTRRELTPWTRTYLWGLPERRLYEGRILALHGGLDDVEQYLRDAGEIQGTAAAVAERFPGVRLCLFAHTHEARLYETENGGVVRRPSRGVARLRPDVLTFLNPGAVDGSRRPAADAAAAWIREAELVVFDSSAWSATFLRVPYDHASSEARSRAAGYRITPLARRLYSARRWARDVTRAASRRLALDRPSSPRRAA